MLNVDLNEVSVAGQPALPEDHFTVTSSELAQLLDSVVRVASRMLLPTTLHLGIGLYSEVGALLTALARYPGSIVLYGVPDIALPNYSNLKFVEVVDGSPLSRERFLMVFSNIWQLLIVATPGTDGRFHCVMTQAAKPLGTTAALLGALQEYVSPYDTHYELTAHLFWQIANSFPNVDSFARVMGAPLRIAGLLVRQDANRWGAAVGALQAIMNADLVSLYRLDVINRVLTPIISTGVVAEVGLDDDRILTRAALSKEMITRAEANGQVIAFPLLQGDQIWGAAELVRSDSWGNEHDDRLNLIAEIMRIAISEYDITPTPISAPPEQAEIVYEVVDQPPPARVPEEVIIMPPVETQYILETEVVYWPELDEFERAADETERVTAEPMLVEDYLPLPDTVMEEEPPTPLPVEETVIEWPDIEPQSSGFPSISTFDAMVADMPPAEAEEVIDVFSMLARTNDTSGSAWSDSPLDSIEWQSNPPSENGQVDTLWPSLDAFASQVIDARDQSSYVPDENGQADTLWPSLDAFAADNNPSETLWQQNVPSENGQVDAPWPSLDETSVNTALWSEFEKTLAAEQGDIQNQIHLEQSIRAQIEAQLVEEQASRQRLEKELFDEENNRQELEQRLTTEQATIAELRAQIEAEQHRRAELEQALLIEQESRAQAEKLVAQEQSIVAQIEAQLLEEQSRRESVAGALTDEENLRVEIERRLMEESQYRQSLDEQLQAEQNARSQVENAIVVEQDARAELEAELTRERDWTQNLESAIAVEQNARMELEAELTREQGLRAQIEAMLHDEQNARLELEAQLQREPVLRDEVERALAEGQAERAELESRLNRETEIIYELQEALERERAARTEAERQLEHERAARTEAEYATVTEIAAGDGLPSGSFLRDVRLFVTRMRERVNRLKKTGAAVPASQDRLVDQIANETNTVIEILSEIALIAQIDVRKHAVADLGSLLQEVLGGLYQHAGQRHVSLQPGQIEPNVSVVGDHEAVLRALYNVVLSCVYMSVSQSSVGVTLARRGGNAEVRIVFSSTEELNSKLESFMQHFDKGVPRRSALALARTIILHHQGKLTSRVLDNEATTEIVVSLPLARN